MCIFLFLYLLDKAEQELSLYKHGLAGAQGANYTGTGRSMGAVRAGIGDVLRLGRQECGPPVSAG